jgi:hypothetical protein
MLDYIYNNIIKQPNGCWEWQLGKDKDGYGYLRTKWRTDRVHRVVYRLTKGSPNGAWVLHTCDNPCCCNPEHLFLGTSVDNAKDRAEKGRSYRPIGELAPQAKLNEQQIKEIRLLEELGYKKQVIKKFFKISDSLLHYILKRHTWRHVKPFSIIEAAEAYKQLKPRIAA